MKFAILKFKYLFIPWSRVLLEKLTGFAASQEIPRIYGTPTFITVLTSARHLSLSWARSIQSPKPPSTPWRSLLILSSHLRLGLPKGLFPQASPPKPCAHISPPLPHTRHMPSPSHSSYSKIQIVKITCIKYSYILFVNLFTYLCYRVCSVSKSGL
jgi:hypothetical protein